MPFEINDVWALKNSDSGKALLVEAKEAEDDPVWIPHSQITADSEVYEPEHYGKLVITDWLADQKGWT